LIDCHEYNQSRPSPPPQVSCPTSPSPPSHKGPHNRFVHSTASHISSDHPQGTLCFLQEVLGSKLSGTPANISKDASPLVRALGSAHIGSKAVKMAIYGFLVSAPLSHFLIGVLQKAFAGQTSTRAKIAQILASNLLISPIQTSCQSPISM